MSPSRSITELMVHTLKQFDTEVMNLDIKRLVESVNNLLDSTLRVESIVNSIVDEANELLLAGDDLALSLTDERVDNFVCIFDTLNSLVETFITELVKLLNSMGEWFKTQEDLTNKWFFFAHLQKMVVYNRNYNIDSLSTTLINLRRSRAGLETIKTLFITNPSHMRQISLVSRNSFLSLRDVLADYKLFVVALKNIFIPLSQSIA